MVKPASKADRELLRIMWDFTLPEAERISASARLADTANSDLSTSYVELLKLDRSPAMRRSVIAALGRIARVSSADMSVVRTLERIVVSDKNPAVRCEAEIAISQILKRFESDSRAGKHRAGRKRSGGSGTGKNSSSANGAKAWVIDSELVSQTLKGPG